VKRLLIDIGNSRLKWAMAENAQMVCGDAHLHHGDPAAVFERVAAQLPEMPNEVWFANVAGDAAAAQIKSAVNQRWKFDAHQAQVIGGQGGLQLAYATPQRLGIDRWLMMQALWMQYRRAFVVVSAGTALTFDAVDANGKHLGGVIAPGLITMQAAVLGATRFEAAGPSPNYIAGLGADTESCVRQGALHACAGLVDRLASRHAPAETLAVISGGDAQVLASHLERKWHHRADLVLEGLLALGAQSP
jgi:type III pantothenate kinase